MVIIVSVPAPTKRAWGNSAELPDGRSSRTGPNLNSARQSASAPPSTRSARPDTFGQSLLPRPKAVARSNDSPWGVQLRSAGSRGNWADEDDDCNDFNNVFDDLEAEADDEAMQTADELPHSKGPPSSLGQSEGAPPKSDDHQSLSPLQRRMAELEAQKQADKVEMAAMRANTDKQLALLKSEMETAMLDMVNQIGDINSGMKALESGMHTGLAAQTAATVALGTELRGLLQQLIDQKSSPAPSAGRKTAESRSLSRDSRSPRRSKRSASRRGKR